MKKRTYWSMTKGWAIVIAACGIYAVVATIGNIAGRFKRPQEEK